MSDYQATSLWDYAAALARAVDGDEDTAATAVLEAHSFDDFGKCQECDSNERIAYWPCATVRIVAKCYGIEVPS